MNKENLFLKLNEKARKIAKKIKERKKVNLIGHIDADGITSTAIMIKALQSKEINYSVKNIKQLYKKEINELNEKELNIFIDLGSGQKTLIKKTLKEFIIIDHHQVIGKESEYELNPNYYGLDGSKEASAASTALIVAKALKEENKKLAWLAVIGSLGDLQDFNGGLIGLNKEIALEAEKNKLIKIEKDIRIYGRNSRPLIQFILFSTDPVIPGLTGNYENVINFLKEKKIKLREGNKWRTYLNLNEKEKKEIIEGLMEELILNEKEKDIKRLIGEVYSLSFEEIESPLYCCKQFATLINSCSRHKKEEIALKVCLGDRGNYYNEMLKAWDEHKRILRQGIEFITRNGIKEGKNYYLVNGSNKVSESTIGIVSGMLYGSGLIQQKKPIIGLCEAEKGMIKLSARANYNLVKKGLNLSKAMKEIETHVNSFEGGGHKVAAGAKFSEKEKEKVLNKLKEIIEKQMNK